MSVAEWQIAIQTHCGNVRRNNEDAVLTLKHYPLFAVADGMGGHQAGEVASQLLIDRLRTIKLDAELPIAARQVEQSILASNADIIDYSERHLHGETMGTTVVAMLSHQSRGVCLWAGDSRLYRLRGGQLQQLTEDHSYVAELVKAGSLQPEQAAHHPSANILTRTVGVRPSLSLDRVDFDLASGDTFLLCSDGLYNEVDNDELQSTLQAPEIHRASTRLLNLCLNRDARDNVSFIIARALDQNPDHLDTTLTYYPAG